MGITYQRKDSTSCSFKKRMLRAFNGRGRNLNTALTDKARVNQPKTKISQHFLRTLKQECVLHKCLFPDILEFITDRGLSLKKSKGAVNMNFTQAKEKLKSSGQEQVLKYFDELNDAEKEELLSHKRLRKRRCVLFRFNDVKNTDLSALFVCAPSRRYFSL